MQFRFTPAERALVVMTTINEASSSQRPLFLLMPGLFLPASFWTADLLARLQAFGDCICLSLPGHFPEPSLPADTHYDKTFVLDSIDTQLADNGVPSDGSGRPLILFGHSTGALMSLYYASQRKQLITAVIAIGGTCDGQEEENIYYWNQLATRYLGRLGMTLTNLSARAAKISPGAHKLAMKAAFLHPDRVFSQHDFDQTVDRYFPDLQSFDAATAGPMLHDLYNFDASEELATLTMPCWITAGEEDAFVPERRTRQLAALIPDAELDFIPNAGHLPFVEDEDRFIQLMTAFMRKAGLVSELQPGFQQA